MSAMANVTLFEHERTSGFGWSDRDLAALESLRRAAGAEVLRATVADGRRELQATQFVGVVRLGGRTVQVLPKIHRAGAGAAGADGAAEATANLLHMLAYAGQLPVREHALAPLLRHGRDWFEILTRLFATHLLEEWQRGPFRHYRTVEDELTVLRGKWRVAEGLRRGPARAHVFAVAYDEFTADNALNRVFRFVVEKLWRLTRDAGNRRLLGDLRQWMEEVALLPHVAGRDARGLTLTRLNQRFAPLVNLARLFLEGGALRLAAGDLSTFAFVFDMNQLFESFLVGFVRRHRDEILTGELESCELLSQSAGETRHLARDADMNRPVFRLKPDLAFRLSGQFPLLLDAKYKRLDPADARLGVSPADLYQMHAYARRYDCPRVLLVYPQTADAHAPLRRRFTLEGTDQTVEAATLDLRIDLRTREGKRRLSTQLRELLSPASPPAREDV